MDNERSLEWEPFAALPDDRIAAMEAFHASGIETWVSLEPVLDPSAVVEIIRQTHRFVNLFKVGKLNHENSLSSRFRAQVDDIDWGVFGAAAIDTLDTVGAQYYIKDDLAAFLPSRYLSRCRQLVDFEHASQ
jgi:hypothetical protein